MAKGKICSSVEKDSAYDRTGCYPSESDMVRSYCVLSDLFTGL